MIEPGCFAESTNLLRGVGTGDRQRVSLADTHSKDGVVETHAVLTTAHPRGIKVSGAPGAWSW